MVNKITRGIAGGIKNAFSGAVIYTEEVKQGFKRPSFYIQPVSVRELPLIGRRYARKYLYCVTYFPEDGLMAAQEAAERLYTALKRITADDGELIGGGMRHEMADGNILFFAEYRTIGYREAERTEYMEEVEIIGGAEGIGSQI